MQAETYMGVDPRRDHSFRLPNTATDQTHYGAAIQAAIQATAEKHGVGFGKLGQPLRVAVTGGGVSPPIDVTMTLVGRQRCLQRIGRARDFIRDRKAATN